MPLTRARIVEMVAEQNGFAKNRNDGKVENRPKPTTSDNINYANFYILLILKVNMAFALIYKIWLYIPMA